MDLLLLKNRFQLYAEKHKDLKHIPGDKNRQTFFAYDLGEIGAAIANAITFPCLFFEFPDTEKDGTPDNIHETYNLSYTIWKQLKDGDYQNKASIIQDCKTISDAIYNRILSELNDFYDAEISKTNEGSISTSDLLHGWRVDLSFTQVYDGQVTATDWEDLV